MIGLSKYLTFAIGLIFAFGVIFELPLIFLLGRVGSVSYPFWPTTGSTRCWSIRFSPPS